MIDGLETRLANTLRWSIQFCSVFALKSLNCQVQRWNRHPGYFGGEICGENSLLELLTPPLPSQPTPHHTPHQTPHQPTPLTRSTVVRLTGTKFLHFLDNKAPMTTGSRCLICDSYRMRQMLKLLRTIYVLLVVASLWR